MMILSPKMSTATKENYISKFLLRMQRNVERYSLNNISPKFQNFEISNLQIENFKIPNV